MRQLILKSFQSPGDIVMLTAAVRDLHAAHPQQFQTDVRTSADALWENNPHLTRLAEGTAGVESIDMHYPIVHQSNQWPYHFLHGYVQYLEERLKLRVPVTKFSGDIHLSPAEKRMPPPGKELGVGERYWIIVAGGKYDFTAKWWDPESYQKVVDHFTGRIQFVQVGEAGHWHPPLTGVVNLIGKTTLREFVRLMHHADGVICPVTFAMHLAASVEMKAGRPRHRPCVVIAGGREPPHWEAYPHHQFLSTVGTLSCCLEGGCWKSRCQLVGDSDEKDRRDVCEQPVQLTPELRIPKCLHMISAYDVIRRIQLYYEGGAISLPDRIEMIPVPEVVAADTTIPESPFSTASAEIALGATAEALSQNEAKPRFEAKPTTAPTKPIEATPVKSEPVSHNVLLTFQHGLGDAIQFTSVLRHLRHYHPDWCVDVQTLIGKHSAFSGLCRKVFTMDRDPSPRVQYHERYAIEWHECRTADRRWPSTKVTRCLQDVFQLTPVPELCQYKIAISDAARNVARHYLESICGPAAPDDRFRAVLIHYQGNTSGEQKNLDTDLVRELCDEILRLEHVPVILDWDRRSPLPDFQRIFCPEADHLLWNGVGTGDAEQLAALIDAARLMIGVDSGPLHVAGATNTPTIGVWTQHHPIHFFDLAENVLHLIPSGHEQLVEGPAALEYFHEHYRHRV